MTSSKIPVRISPLFWVTAAIIGWINSMSLIGMLIWIVIIFVSILVHEYGHAVTAKAFGQYPSIELVAFGGMTYPEGPKLPLWKEFFVVLNGPLFGFCLFLIATAVLKIPAVASSGAMPILQVFRMVNLFWTVVNLFPVLPLDGGQLLRIILEGLFGVKGLKVAMMASLIIAVGIAVISFFYGWFLIGAIFLLFAFQNVQSWRSAKSITASDQNVDYQKELFEAEEAMIRGDEQKAQALLEKLRQESKSGMLYVTATEHLARLKFKAGDLKTTFELLISIKASLSDDLLEVLHVVAFELEEFSVVIDLSSSCFKSYPTLEVALRNAIASAHVQDVEAVIGWLEAAVRFGLDNLNDVVNESVFDKLRDDERFVAFIKNHSKSQES